MRLDALEPSLFERYFIDPEVEDGALHPGCIGVACWNVRAALRHLGYDVDYGDGYDQQLADAVRQFQTDREHRSKDGLVGPGARALLVRELLEAFPPAIFKRGFKAPASGRIFVSYRREDTGRIESYVDALRIWGFEVWYDKGIPGGADWAAMLEQKVDESDVVVVFLSRAALESRWVKREVEFADARSKAILAVRLDDGDLAQGWGVLLSSNQILDASEPDFLPALGRALDHIVRRS